VRTVWVPDFSAGESLLQPVQIPEPGGPGYISSAERMAQAGTSGDPWAQSIAREQAMEEHLELQALAADAEAEAGG
jgi:hypothetical protein